MDKNNPKKSGKSIGFLSIVTCLVVLVWIGYTVSTAVAQTPQTIKTDQKSEITTQDISQANGWSVFSTLESAVAHKATSLWNGVIGNKQNVNEVSESENQWVRDEKSTFSSDTLWVSLAQELPLPNVYDDIATSAYRDDILVLYSQWLWESKTHFNPANYVRISDFIRVTMDAYGVQKWLDPNNMDDTSEIQYIFDDDIPDNIMDRVNRAYEAWFLQNMKLWDDEWDSRLTEFIKPSEAQGILRLMSIKNPSLVQIPSELAFSSQKYLRKDEMAKLVRDSLQIELNERSLPVFSDIYWSKYQSAIQTLANYGIVAWVNGKFYPDAWVERKDFVIMLSRILLLQQNRTFAPIDNFYYLTNIKNVSLSASFAPYLEFCLEYKMCNSLLSQTQWGVSFSANKQLSFSEVNNVLSAISAGRFILPASADWNLITRWELANLLVQIIQLSSNVSNEKQEDKKAESPSWRTQFQEFMKVS